MLYVFIILVLFVAIALWSAGTKPQQKETDLPLPLSKPRIKQNTEAEKRGDVLPISMPSKFISLDLETTGLRPDWCEIIEIGAILFDVNSQNHTTYNVLIKPKNKIPAKITELTGITQEMVEADGVTLEQGIKDLKQFIGNYPVVAYNAKFDTGFLKKAYQNCGFNYNSRTYCALELARQAFPYLENHKLATVSEYLNLDTAGAHRALKDCVLAGLVFVASKRAIG
tara:strand:+ start:10534 stop:11211 length:678 start_codon:yes stop_codon:yes gene_type:complete